MKKIKVFLRGLSVALFSSLFVAGTLYAATTIGSNIITAGTLTVSGLSTFSSNLLVAPAFGIDTSAAGALNIGTSTASSISIGKLGVTTSILGSASTTALSASSFWVGGNATTTSSGQFSTVGNIGAGTSTPVTELAASGSATTTLNLYTSGASKGSCIQLIGSAGSAYRIYVGGAGTLVTEAGTCK